MHETYGARALGRFCAIAEQNACPTGSYHSTNARSYDLAGPFQIRQGHVAAARSSFPAVDSSAARHIDIAGAQVDGSDADAKAQASY